MFKQLASLVPAAVIASSLAISGCDGSVRRDGPPEIDFQLVRVDAERNRRWVLELDSLTVYDNLNGRRLRRLILPGWAVARLGDACPPDLAIDASGAAFVSSNVQPVLWRIDPHFGIARIALTLESDDDKDVGFTRLVFAADGVLTSAGTTFPSRWRIDLQTARATKLASLPAPELCDTPGLLRTAQRN